MKKYVYFLLAFIITAGVTFTVMGIGKTKPVGNVLTIKDIQADPTAYKGTVSFTGTVAGYSQQDPKVFALIDTSEAKLCKSTGCANFYVTVKYEGDKPKEWDEVNVTGEFVQNGQLFTATKVDVIRHLNI